MNVVLLVNSINLPDIRAFVEAAAQSQTTKTPGAIAVVYQGKLGVPLIQELVAPLLPVFSSASSLPVPIAASASNDARNATLFALFVAQVYARYPGPWLVIDGPGIPTIPDFVTEAFKQHKVLGGKVTGRASTEGSGLTPVGPVILGLPAKDLKWFSPGSTESWRARARFLLGRCGFAQVPIDQYLFTIPKSPFKAVVDEQQELEELISSEKKGAPETPASPPVFDAGSLDGSTSEVASTQPNPVPKRCKFGVGDNVRLIGSDAPVSAVSGIFPIDGGDRYRIGLKDNTELFDEDELEASPWLTEERLEGLKADVISLHTPDAIPQGAEPCPYDNLSDEDLRTQIEIRDLPKPHHKTGRARLLQILCEDDDARRSNS